MAYIGNIPAEQFTSVDIQNFSVSATANYTLDRPVANENEIELFINNVRQHPGSGKAYTASGTALTLSEATAGTDTMYCVYQGKARQTVTPATSSVTNAMLAGSIDLTSKVTGALPQANIADQAINEAKMQISNAPTNGYMLTAQSGNTGGLTWAEAPSGGLVPITTVAFSSGTELVINNCFSATYLNYMMIISLLVPQSDASLNYRFNVGGTVDSTSNYRYTLEGYQNSGSGTSSYSNGTTDEGRLFYDIDADSEAGASGVFYIHNPYGGYQRKQIHGNTILQKGTASNTTQYQVASDYHNSSVKNFTGINLFSSGATNWRAGSTSGGYGRVSIFGIVNS